MGLSVFTVIWTIFNVLLLIAIVVGLFALVKYFISSIYRHKAMDKKLDTILNKLDNDKK